MPVQSPSGRHDSGSACPVNGSSRAREVELAPVKGRGRKESRYELLGDDDANDADGGVLEVGGGSASGVRATPTGNRCDSDGGGGGGGSGGEEERGPGITPQRGLLSTPNVKMILFIVAIVQVGYGVVVLCYVFLGSS